MRKREQDLSGDIPIREIRLNTEEADLPEEEEYDEKPRPERRRNRNTELVLITWLFSVMFLLLAGGEENIRKRDELWQYVKEKDPQLYRRLRSQVVGLSATLPGKGGRKMSIALYHLAQKIWKFN